MKGVALTAEPRLLLDRELPGPLVFWKVNEYVE
jgi:hypothetical protein